MTLGPVFWACLLLVPFVLGAGILRVLGVAFRTDRLAYAGWALAMGTFGTALVLFAWLWTEPDVEAPLGLVLFLVALAGALGLLGRVRVEPVLASEGCEQFTAAPRWERAFFWIVVVAVLLVTLQHVLVGSLTAIVQSDEASFWAYRGKILYHCGGFTEAHAKAMERPVVHNVDYPILNPLLHVWAFVHAGGITDVVNRVPFQALSLALVPILAAALRRTTRPAVAALLLLLLPTSQHAISQAQRAHSDVLVALGLLVALDAWLRWRATRHAAWVRLGALGLALAAWSKHEGALFLLAIVVAASLPFARHPRELVRRLRLARGSIWLLLPPAMLVLTAVFNSSFDSRNNFMSGAGSDASFLELFMTQFAERCPTVVAFMAERVLLDPAHSNCVLLCLLVLCLAFPVAVWRSALRAPALAGVLVLGGFCAVMIGTAGEVLWQLETALPRIAFQLVPPAILWVGAAAGMLFALQPGEEPLDSAPAVDRRGA